MSGGSYDYASSNLGELRSWVRTLESMAERCRGWSADTGDYAGTKYIDGKRVPVTLEDRAHVLVRALLLEHAAKRLSAAVAEVESLEETMHAVEWIASGDWGPDQLMGPLPIKEN